MANSSNHKAAVELIAAILKMIRKYRQDSMVTKKPKPKELPKGYELFEGKVTKVINADRSGWWRYHDHYDRDGYCDNPGRGY